MVHAQTYDRVSEVMSPPAGANVADRTTMKSFFDPVINAIISLVQNSIKDVAGLEVCGLYLSCFVSSLMLADDHTMRRPRFIKLCSREVGGGVSRCVCPEAQKELVCATPTSILLLL